MEDIIKNKKNEAIKSESNNKKEKHIEKNQNNKEKENEKYIEKNQNSEEKEKRKQIAKKALGITIAGNEMPTKETIEIVKQYIDGKIELEEAQKKVIERYKKV